MDYVSLLYEKERSSLSSCACLSENSGGRCFGISECNLRGDFQRDRDRIIHSKAFRDRKSTRLNSSHKVQSRMPSSA